MLPRPDPVGLSASQGPLRGPAGPKTGNCLLKLSGFRRGAWRRSPTLQMKLLGHLRRRHLDASDSSVERPTTGGGKLVRPVLLLAACMGACQTVPPADSGEQTKVADPKWPVENFRRQERSDWCWAACCEMAMAVQGVRVSQASIVARWIEGFKDGESERSHAAPSDVLIRALAVGMSEAKNRGRRRGGSDEGDDVSDIEWLFSGEGKERSLQIDISQLFNAGMQRAAAHGTDGLAVEDFAAGLPVIMGLRDWRLYDGQVAPGHVVFVTRIEYTSRKPGTIDLSKVLRVDGKPAEFLKPKTEYQIRRICFWDPYSPSAEAHVLEGVELQDHLAMLLSPSRCERVVEAEDATVTQKSGRRRR